MSSKAKQAPGKAMKKRARVLPDDGTTTDNVQNKRPLEPCTSSDLALFIKDDGPGFTDELTDAEKAEIEAAIEAIPW